MASINAEGDGAATRPPGAGSSESRESRSARASRFGMAQLMDGSMFGAGQPCFGCGPDHPNGFRLKFAEEGDEVVTRFVPGDDRQGPPGVMHGGLVLTLADELAAWTVIVKQGKFGFTARVNAKLLRPTRIQQEVVGRAKVKRSTRRTAEVEIVLIQHEVETFRGEMTFALLEQAAAEELMGRAMPAEWLKYAR